LIFKASPLTPPIGPIPVFITFNILWSIPPSPPINMKNWTIGIRVWDYFKYHHLGQSLWSLNKKWSFYWLSWKSQGIITSIGWFSRIGWELSQFSGRSHSESCWLGITGSHTWAESWAPRFSFDWESGIVPWSSLFVKKNDTRLG